MFEEYLSNIYGLSGEKQLKYRSCYSFACIDGVYNYDLGNGTIEFSEFLEMMCNKCERADKEEYSDAFKIFDIDGDGFINAHELRNVMENLGERLTEKELEEMMKEADKDGDGLINYTGWSHALVLFYRVDPLY